MLNIIDENYIYIDAFFYSFWMKKNEYNKYKHQTLKEFYENLCGAKHVIK
tara:strand:+ start:8077 stop:8226 length:150 start_codon:yes stop_codon:yes gene_type:complete